MRAALHHSQAAACTSQATGAARAARLLLACGMALAGATAQAGVVNFDDPMAIDLSDLAQVRYSESGYTLSYDATTGSAAALADVGDAGTGALVLLSGSSLTLARSDGGLFNLNELLLGLSALDLSAATQPMLQVFGLMGGLTVQSASLALGTGLAFQAFDAGWSGLSAIRFVSDGDAVLDNIRLTDLQDVPEPGSLGLLAVALLSAGWARRQARRPVQAPPAGAQAATGSLR